MRCCPINSNFHEHEELEQPPYIQNTESEKSENEPSNESEPNNETESSPESDPPPQSEQQETEQPESESFNNEEPKQQPIFGEWGDKSFVINNGSDNWENYISYYVVGSDAERQAIVENVNGLKYIKIYYQGHLQEKSIIDLRNMTADVEVLDPKTDIAEIESCFPGYNVNITISPSAYEVLNLPELILSGKTAPIVTVDLSSSQTEQEKENFLQPQTSLSAPDGTGFSFIKSASGFGYTPSLVGKLYSANVVTGVGETIVFKVDKYLPVRLVILYAEALVSGPIGVGALIISLIEFGVDGLTTIENLGRCQTYIDEKFYRTYVNGVLCLDIVYHAYEYWDETNTTTGMTGRIFKKDLMVYSGTEDDVIRVGIDNYYIYHHAPTIAGQIPAILHVMYAASYAPFHTHMQTHASPNVLSAE